jgi:protein translocation Sec62 family protein
VKALLSPAYAKVKNVPKVTTEAEAEALLQSSIQYAFYLRVDRGAPTGSSISPRHVTVVPQQQFAQDAYFVWLYEGSQWTTYAGGLLMVALMLAAVMFPLWPPVMRLGVWYLSIAMLGLLGAFFGLAIIRLIFYIITVVIASPGIWIFPQLFADVGVVSCAVLCILYSWFLGIWRRSSHSFRCGSGMFQRRKLGRRRKQKLPLVRTLRNSLLIMVGLLSRRLVTSLQSNRVQGVARHGWRRSQMWIHNRIIACL